MLDPNLLTEGVCVPSGEKQERRGRGREELREEGRGQVLQHMAGIKGHDSASLPQRDVYLDNHTLGKGKYLNL